MRMQASWRQLANKPVVAMRLQQKPALNAPFLLYSSLLYFCKAGRDSVGYPPHLTVTVCIPDGCAHFRPDIVGIV